MLIGLFVLLLIRDAAPGLPFLDAGLSPLGTVGVVVGALLACWLAAHVSLVAAGRALDRTGSRRVLLWAERALRGAQVAGFGVLVGAVFGLDWLWVVRGAIGDMVMVDEFVAASPFLVLVVLLGLSHYPIERRIREANIMHALDTGAPVFRIPTRAEFVESMIRHQFGLVLVPVLLVLGWAEAVAMFGQDALASIAPGLSERGVGLVLPAAQLAGVGLIVLVLPLIMRRVLHARPLGAGPLREGIEALCRAHGVRVAETLEWRTHGVMLNAAVMGLAAPVRYMLFTDALLAVLTAEQVRAVAAHEVAHARRRHLPWMMGLLASSVVLIAAAVDVVLGVLPAEGWVGRGIGLSLGLAAVLAAFVVFGLVSRRFEWEADAFAVRHVTEASAPGESGVRITREAADTMVGALLAVARWNHIPVRARSWRHGSIEHRMKRLRKLIGEPVAHLPIDRVARRVRLAILVALSAALVVLAAASRGVVREDERSVAALTDAGGDTDAIHQDARMRQ